MSLFRTKAINTDLMAGSGLKRVLGAFDLTLLGIGAVIGAGIFVLTGIAAAVQSGPALVLSFIIAGIACACAALSYAELAASVGGAGSAYGYSYAGLGELPAWIIGWMLILEYTVSVSAVSVGWSGYVNNALQAVGYGLPDFLMHGPFDKLHPGGLINLPAALIIVTLGTLLVIGAKVSARFNSIMVVIKLVAIAIFIGVASFHVDPANWHPFIPPMTTDADGVNHFGYQGVMAGAAMIFFAYIGFDAVSTAAEETRNPQRDLPIGILASLAICTILYIVVSGLLTGIVPYDKLNVPSPVAFAMLQIHQNWAAGVISIGAIAGLTTVMLVLYYALTRVFFAIARDGLLPQFFSKVNAGSGSPVRCIVLTGVVIFFLAGFVPLGNLVEVTNIGTLGAFCVVCAGVVVLRRARPDLKRPFKTPYSPLIPLLGIGFSVWLMTYLQKETWMTFGIWLTVGLLIYFGYSRTHSALAQSAQK
ncbi:MAG: amino acid permease [Stenotrophobium sp.]